VLKPLAEGRQEEAGPDAGTWEGSEEKGGSPQDG